MDNYYLKLLYKKVKELEKALKIEDTEDNQEYKRYLIAGIIITLSSILETGIGELHSSNFDDLASLIYYTRQKVVHYGYFNGMENIEETASNIVQLADASYQKESEYYTDLFNMELPTTASNIVVKNCSNIIDDTHFYKFKSKDNKQVLCIPPNSIFFLTKKNSEKVISYIVDVSYPAALYTYNKDNIESFKEVTNTETKNFLKDNFQIDAEDYNEHTIVMQNIISSFISDPINSIQIVEFASDEQFCRNTVEIINDYIFKNSMHAAYISNNYLIKDKYSLNKMQKTDYSKLLKDFKKNSARYIDEKDVFFIDITIKRVKDFLYLLSESNINANFKPEVLSSILIQLFESGPKHFSNKFISSSPEFKKCYSNLLRYRQIFSHYILTNKEYRDGVEKFKNEFLGLTKILQSIDLHNVEKSMSPDTRPYISIERKKENFFNYKHEQFLKISRDAYLGKKILYSSHNPDSKSLIAIFQGGNNIANTVYYKKEANGDLTPKYIIDEHTGKRSHMNALSNPIKGVKQFKADLSLSYLFKAYFELQKLSHKTSSITINFHSSKANSEFPHKDSLDMVILRFFNQGYLPAELLQEVKLDTSQLNKGFIHILDKKNNGIATITNESKCNFKHNSYNTDSSDYFSRIDNIAHDFSKRRHSNVK